MAKKGLDEDRLKFFTGMGESEKPDSDKTDSDEGKSVIPESDRSGSDRSESDRSGSDRSESDRSESDRLESVLTESDKQMSVISESDKPESDKSESRLSESDISDSDKPESDKSKPRLSESDNQKPTSRRRRQAPKISLPKSRALSAIPKIRAKKVDDSVLDQAISAASRSPKVSIYSPFVAAVMKCNELTTIGYKSSADSRELLEKALEQAYPDVCEKVRSYMENNRG